jgi:VanZ family protein
MRIIIRYWLPAILWAAVILAASSDNFSSTHTGSILETMLVALFGRQPLTPSAFEWLHFMIRKLAHVTEYGIFGALAFRAARGGRPGWRPAWAVVAVLIALVLASTDEWHQSLVPSRTSSPVDVAIDVVGSTVAQLAIWFRLRGA